MGKCMCKLSRGLAAAFMTGVLALGMTLIPAEVHAASDEAAAVLTAVEQGKLDGMEIEVVELDSRSLAAGFSRTVQAALDQAHSRTDGKLTRIVIPDGKYQPTGRALQIYSNTILDLRGSGAATPDTADDADDVIIYQSTHDDDPPSLRCGGQDDQSHGYDFYQNMTVLGGTIVGKRADGSVQSGNACNVRFGHASNIRIIGTQVKFNHGGHHMEIGGCRNVLVADCRFSEFEDGTNDQVNSEGTSLEAIQLDVTHRENLNFAYYGAHDDLPTCDAVITGCEFDNVRRGVGSHHAVFGAPYENIVVKNNVFRNIEDKAINFVYTRNAEIFGNTIESGVCGIAFQYMSPIQQFQPNDKSKAYTLAQAANFLSNSEIHDNTVLLDGTGDQGGKEVKYGIHVGGREVSEADSQSNYDKERALNDDYSGNRVPVGTLRLCGVKVANNIVNVTGFASGTKCDGIALSDCGGTESTLVTGNKVTGAPRYGLHCNGVANKALSLWKNTIAESGTCGIKLTTSGIGNITSNTIENLAGPRMTSPGISINASSANQVSYNKVRGTDDHGIQITDGSYAKYANSNTIDDPGYHGLFVYKSEIWQAKGNSITNPADSGVALSLSSKGKYITGNKVDGAGKYGIMVYNKSNAENITSNRITKAGAHGIMIGDPGGASPMSQAFLIQGNTITSCKKRGICINTMANAVVGNKVKSCANSNKTFVKKGLTLTKYQITLKKGKTCKIPYLKSSSAGKITWTSSKKKIATVDKKGKVKAKKKGTVYIYAKKNGIKVKAKIIIK